MMQEGRFLSLDAAYDIRLEILVSRYFWFLGFCSSLLVLYDFMQFNLVRIEKFSPSYDESKHVSSTVSSMTCDCMFCA